MPYVNIRVAGVLTRERVAHKPKSYTYIAFDELPDENWAIAGKLLDAD